MKKQKTYYNAIFFSDLHLGLPNSRIDLLKKFLKQSETKHIFIVGDFIDFLHLRTNKDWAKQCRKLFKRLLKCIKHGTAITYMIGNHDSLLYLLEDFEFKNIAIKEKTTHTTENGLKFIILHGDIFDGFLSKSHLFSIIINSFYDLLLEVKLTKPIVEFFKKKIDWITNKTSNYENKAIDYVIENKFDGIICGHSHRPKITRIKGKVYANIGDLIGTNTVIVETEKGDLNLVRLNES